MRWLLLVLISINVWANDLENAVVDTRDFMAGKATTDHIVNANLQEVPKFAGSSPKEASFYDEPNLLKERSEAAAIVDDVAQHLKETASTRPRFKIDPATDPLFKSRDLDPSLTISDDSDDTLATAEGSVEKTCEEGGEDVTYECLENRHITPQVPMKTATLTVNHLAFSPKMESYVVQTSGGGVFHHGKWETRHRQNGWIITLPTQIDEFKAQFCKNFVAKDSVTGQIFNIDCNRIQQFKINNGSVSQSHDKVTIAVPSFVVVGHRCFWRKRQIQQPLAASMNITLIHDTYEGEEIDEWTGCEQFEDLIDQGLCQYAKRELTIGPETRNINGYAIFKDEWQYKQIYHCKMIKDECSVLRSKGCTQINSRCKEFRQNKCWIYEQTYSCPDGKISISKIKAPKGSAFCLTGNCHDASYQANGNMLDVMSKLTMLQEVQKDMNAQKNPADLKVFRGGGFSCTRNCVNFKDCCGRMKGWGVKVHLANCKPEEQQLAIMRDQNLCHQVGATYCAKKVLRRCISKKTSFCCFGTRFAKILQQQGRSQLGIGWGDPKCPDCRPLTIEELSKLDLSKMNFSELFEDLMKKYKSPNLKKLQQATSNKITEHMERVTAGLKNNEKVAQTGVIGEKKDSL